MEEDLALDVARFRRVTSGPDSWVDVTDMTDDQVASLSVFVWWRAGEQIRVLGRMILEDLAAGIAGVLVWLTRKVRR